MCGKVGGALFCFSCRSNFVFFFPSFNFSLYFHLWTCSNWTNTTTTTTQTNQLLWVFISTDNTHPLPTTTAISKYLVQIYVVLCCRRRRSGLISKLKWQQQWNNPRDDIFWCLRFLIINSLYTHTQINGNISTTIMNNGIMLLIPNKPKTVIGNVSVCGLHCRCYQCLCCCCCIYVPGNKTHHSVRLCIEKAEGTQTWKKTSTVSETHLFWYKPS